MAKVICTELQKDGASGPNITLDTSKNVTCENNLTVDGTSTLTGNVSVAGTSTLTGNVTVGADLIATKQNGCERIILEQFFCPCDGSVIATSNGNITIVDKDNIQLLSTSYADILGSNISYNPPTGTTQVIYEFTTFGSRDNDDIPFGHFKFFIDSDEVTDARATIGSEYHAGFINFKWGINIGGSAVTATGRQASWSSAKTLKLQAREYGSDNEVKLNETYHWDGGASAQFHRPQIGITAIG